MEQEIQMQTEPIIYTAGGGAVDSVNGYTGVVVLTTSDLENTSDYQTGSEVESAISTAIAGKQDTLTAGNNITIQNDTISATDTTYTAGYGLGLSGTEFSVDNSTIATQNNVTNLQGQIDALAAASDVTDIVGTYADLEAYDTTHLKDNDIIKVLQDETHDDETTYYRWSTTTETFTLIGEEGPYYTKAAADLKFQDKLTAGTNITIASDNTISATDTTYSAFTGTDGTAAGTAGLVPAPATTDAGKYLKADGTWDTVSAGPTVVQTTGTSTTDVMSQNATTGMVFADPGTNSKVRIGTTTTGSGAVSIGQYCASNGTHSVAIGSGAKTTNDYSVAIGSSAIVRNNSRSGICIGDVNGPTNGVMNNYGIAIGSYVGATGVGSVSIGSGSVTGGNAGVALGYNGQANGVGSVAIGSYSSASSVGEMNIGSSNTSYGYNSSNYRLLSGVYDGQSAHDAATYGQLNTRLGGLSIVSISQTDYDNLQTVDPNTLYVITGA